MNNDASTARVIHVPRSPGYWQDVWRRFRRKLFPMLGLTFVAFLVIVAVFAPAIAGTKPIICEYKGTTYIPALGYLNSNWENPIFRIDKFRGVYPENLTKNDPKAWAIWPLVYQDPYRRVRANEWPGLPAAEPLMAPDRYHWFGTDPAGVDVFAKMVHGTRTALVVGFISMGLAAVIGITLGAIAGYFGGWVDAMVSRLIEVVMCVPTLILILALIAIVERPTIWHMMGIIGLTGWTSVARLTRGEFLRLRGTEFVLAALALGIRRPIIIFKHVLPNALAPVLVPVTFGIATAILTEAALSFLGFGAPPPNPSWGTILDAGRANLSKWWLVTFPGVAILFTVLAYNLVGEGLQEATDPRLRDGRA